MRTLLKKRFLIPLFLIVLIAIIIFIFKIPRYYTSAHIGSDPEWGVTFSKKYSEELGLDWKKTYIAILEELGVDHIRIPVYWDDIETTRSTIDLSNYLFMVNEARSRNRGVVLVIGERLPRWPECHVPEWATTLSQIEKTSKNQCTV